MSRVSSRRMPVASGPTSSYDWGRITPPVTTIFMRDRTTSSLAMLSALVTMVSCGPSAPTPDRSGRAASARATSVVVVPPVSPTTMAGATRVGGGGADALLLRGVLGRLVAQRQVVGDAVDDRPTAGTGDHLLLGQLVEVPADGRLGHVEPLGRVLDASSGPSR